MEPRVSYLVGRLDRILRRRLGDALAPHGLSLPEYTTLSVLRARPGPSNAQLARRSLITPQAMNEVLARLEGRGLVRREVDPAHARIRRARLTAAGETLLAGAPGWPAAGGTLPAAAIAARAPVGEGLTPGFRESLADVLRGLE